jgi:hypothetical protein
VRRARSVSISESVLVARDSQRAACTENSCTENFLFSGKLQTLACMRSELQVVKWDISASPTRPQRLFLLDAHLALRMHNFQAWGERQFRVCVGLFSATNLKSRIIRLMRRLCP